MPQNRSGRFSPSASFVIGIVEVFEARIALRRQLRLEPGVELLLDLGILDDRFDHQVARRQLGVDRGRVEQARRIARPSAASGPFVSLSYETSSRIC